MIQIRYNMEEGGCIQMGNKKFLGFIGTYTKGDSEGIYSFVFDQEQEKITDVKLAAKVGNPTYLTITKDNTYVYAVAKDGDKGGVCAYRINKQFGELQEINRQLTDGSSPCYVGVNKTGETVVASYYHRGTVEAYVTNPDGSLNERTSEAQHKGSGPNKERQEKPHTHYSDFTPSEKFIAVVDLGIDQILTYEVSGGHLKQVQSLTLKPGSGPRHLVFHPNGKFAYCLTELSNEVVVLSFNEEDGIFKELQYISSIPEDFTENSQGSAIRITSDGKFVYAGNRGHNSIAIFQVDEQTGKLTLVDIASSEGDWPRDFQFDPTEHYIIGSNQESGNLVLYKRNPETGKLTVLQNDIPVPYPVCVAFLHQ